MKAASELSGTEGVEPVEDCGRESDAFAGVGVVGGEMKSSDLRG